MPIQPQPESPVSPHSLEAERAVLGAILVHNEAFHDAAEILDARDFFRDAHRRIFERIVALSERSVAIDFVTLKDELTRFGELEEVGGPAYIASLGDGVPRSANAEYYAKIVAEKAHLRRLAKVGLEMHAAAHDPAGLPADIIERADAALLRIARRDQRGEFIGAAALVAKCWPVVEELMQNRGRLTGLSTGFVELDRMTHGLKPGSLTLVAARPSMGKTALALTVALQAAQAGHAVAFASLEMSEQELFFRMLAMTSDVDGQRLTSGQFTERDYPRLMNGLGLMDTLPLYIDESSAQTPSALRGKARRLVKKQSVELLIIDYLQLMEGDGKAENRNLEVSAISRSLKRLAKELKIPIVALSQLSRGIEGRAEKRPMLSDLRESGALEQDADTVLMIYREEQYKSTPENAGVAEVIVAKQRNGPTGTVRLRWRQEQSRFEDWHAHDVPAAAAEQELPWHQR